VTTDQNLSAAALEQILSAYQHSLEMDSHAVEDSLLALFDAPGAPDLGLYAAEQVCQPGEIILREDDPGDHIYIIRMGVAAVIKGELESPTILAFRTRGGMIGEMALLEDEPRSATVVALDPTVLWCMSRAAFDHIAGQYPQFTLSMMRILSARLRRSAMERKQVVETGRLREAALRQYQEQAMRDPLTGWFNRRYLEETLAREISRAQRENEQVGILILDIDYFKRINATYGHQAGDAILCALAVLRPRCIRAEDIACRYGGEEFVVVMPGAPLRVSRERAELIRQAFQDLSTVAGDQIMKATLSIGAAVFPKDGDGGTIVLARADQALYQAKAAGRNRVVIFEAT